MRLSPLLTGRVVSLERRKGGGGHGGGEGGGGHSGGDDGGGSSGSSGSSSEGGSPGGNPDGSSGSHPNEPSFGVPSSSGSSKSAVSYGDGSTTITTIPAGQPFAGRTVGGGTRSGVFGTQVYGSGYGTSNRGVAGLGFPYYFWPIVWLGHPDPAYISEDATEYGSPINTSRPGGALEQVAIKPTPPATETYHIISDGDTLNALITFITQNCTVGNQPLQAVAYTGNATGDPEPEQAIQYYRASSVVLTLDGYNNTAALSNDTTMPATPLPIGLNATFLNCINQTIGAGVPLVSDEVPNAAAPNFALFSVNVGASPLLLWAAVLVLSVRRVF